MQQPGQRHRDRAQQQPDPQRQRLLRQGRGLGDHLQRPVHQIQRVRDRAQELHRREAEHAPGMEPARRGAADEQRRSGQHRQCGTPPREGGALIEGDHHEREDHQARPGQQARALRPQPARAGAQQEGDQRPRAELPGPGGQGEEGPRLGDVHQQHARQEGGRGERGRAEHQPLLTAPAHPEPGRQKQRPEEVELLLDAEGPVVLEHRRGGFGEIVRALLGEEVVRHVQSSHHCAPQHVRHEQRRHPDPGREQAQQGDQQRRRQDAARPLGVERAEADPPLPFERLQQMRGDQEAGDHEEDVHAHEPARERRDPGVVEQHQHHRDRAQALDVGAEAGLRPRGVSRFAQGHCWRGGKGRIRVPAHASTITNR